MARKWGHQCFRRWYVLFCAAVALAARLDDEDATELAALSPSLDLDLGASAIVPGEVWKDDSGNGYDAVPGNGTGGVNGSGGVAGEYYSFDGKSNYMLLKGINFDKEPIKCLMVEVTFRTNATNSTGSLIDFDGNEWFNLFIRSDNGFAQSVSTSNPKNTTPNADLVGSTALNDGDWHTIVYKMDANESSLAVDGDKRTIEGQHKTGIGGLDSMPRFGFIGGGREADTGNGTGNKTYFEGDISALKMSLQCGDATTTAEPAPLETTTPGPPKLVHVMPIPCLPIAHSYHKDAGHPNASWYLLTESIVCGPRTRKSLGKMGNSHRISKKKCEAIVMGDIDCGNQMNSNGQDCFCVLKDEVCDQTISPGHNLYRFGVPEEDPTPCGQYEKVTCNKACTSTTATTTTTTTTTDKIYEPDKEEEFEVDEDWYRTGYRMGQGSAWDFGGEKPSNSSDSSASADTY